MNLSSAIAALFETNETENERRLRVLAEAKEHIDFCEKDWQDRGDAAVTPFAAWKDND